MFVLSDSGSHTYSVTATDSVGSTSAPATASPAVPTPLTVSISQTDGVGEVFLSADVSGGTPPFSFVWSNGATTQVITVSEPGTYQVTVIDVFGCDGTAAFTVTSIPT